MPEFFGPFEYATVIVVAVLWLAALVGIVVSTIKMHRLRMQFFKARLDAATKAARRG